METLPPPLQQAVWSQLTPTALAQCSLTCRAWRHLPHRQLDLLSIGKATRLPPDQLRHCANLRRIVVENGSGEAWQHGYGLALLAQKLPRLAHVQVAYSSAAATDGQCDLIESVQRAQGCELQLAATNKAALSTLAGRRMPGLVQLDVNVPYLFAGAVELILQAAALQGPDCRISLWVCCWGGCDGLELEAAQQLHQALPPGQLVGLEAINVRQQSDLLALSALNGLTALGLNLKAAEVSQASAAGVAAQAATAAAAAAAAGAMAAPAAAPAEQAAAAANAAAVAAAAGAAVMQLSAATGAEQQQSSPAALERLSSLMPVAALAGTLRQLTLHGTPRGGWADPAVFSQLTGLTKLSLLSDHGADPLPLQPFIGALAPSLVTLALERAAVQEPGELRCVSALTKLELLSIKLSHMDPPAVGTDAYEECCGGDNSSSESSGDDDGAQAAAARLEHLSVADHYAGALQLRRGRRAVRPPRDPGMLDLSWLRCLNSLKSAWLEVPTLELTHLPTSLEELDAQKLSSSAATWVTCAGCERLLHPGGGGATSGAAGPPPLLHLPRLRQLLLPFHGDCCDARYLDALVLAVCGCSELRELDLVGWQLTEAGAAAAVGRLPRLRQLGMAMPAGSEDSADAWRAVCERLSGAAASTRLSFSRHRAVRMYSFAMVQEL